MQVGRVRQTRTSLKDNSAGHKAKDLGENLFLNLIALGGISPALFNLNRSSLRLPFLVYISRLPMLGDRLARELNVTSAALVISEDGADLALCHLEQATA